MVLPWQTVCPGGSHPRNPGAGPNARTADGPTGLDRSAAGPVATSLVSARRWRCIGPSARVHAAAVDLRDSTRSLKPSRAMRACNPRHPGPERPACRCTRTVSGPGVRCRRTGVAGGCRRRAVRRPRTRRRLRSRLRQRRLLVPRRALAPSAAVIALRPGISVRNRTGSGASRRPRSPRPRSRGVGRATSSCAPCRRRRGAGAGFPGLGLVLRPHRRAGQHLCRQHHHIGARCRHHPAQPAARRFRPQRLACDLPRLTPLTSPPVRSRPPRTLAALRVPAHHLLACGGVIVHRTGGRCNTWNAPRYAGRCWHVGSSSRPRFHHSGQRQFDDMSRVRRRKAGAAPGPRGVECSPRSPTAQQPEMRACDAALSTGLAAMLRAISISKTLRTRARDQEPRVRATGLSISRAG